MIVEGRIESLTLSITVHSAQATKFEMFLGVVLIPLESQLSRKTSSDLEIQARGFDPPSKINRRRRSSSGPRH